MVWPNKPKVVLLPLHISKDDKIYYLKAVFPKRWYGFELNINEHNIFLHSRKYHWYDSSNDTKRYTKIHFHISIIN